jgi:hypothetical protein
MWTIPDVSATEEKKIIFTPMGISLSEIGTSIPFFQSALQIFTPLNMACKYTRIFCPVLYILGR